MFKPPTPYYGGKQSLVKWLLPLFPKHTLYVETHFGGGALFFAKEPSEVEVINDLNGFIINFYEVIVNDFDRLYRLIRATLHSRGLYLKAYNIYKQQAHHTRVLKAWAFYILTTQGFASKIGSWGFDNTRNTTTKKVRNSIKRFTEAYKERLQNAQIECLDAVDLIGRRDRPEAFFYIDPPYFNSNCGHYSGYTEADYRRQLDALIALQGKFMLSSYPSAILSDYVKRFGWQYKELTKRVAVSHRVTKMKTEVVVCNYDIL